MMLKTTKLFRAGLLAATIAALLVFEGTRSFTAALGTLIASGVCPLLFITSLDEHLKEGRETENN